MKTRFLLLAVSLTLAAQQKLTLADLERMALAASPALAQRGADIRAAQGRTQQAGLYPNPVLGSSGEHIAGGPVLRGGTIGGFVEQRIVTAGKLGLARRSAEQTSLAYGQMQESERLRVLAGIRMLYYDALAGERLLEVRTQMAELAERTANTARESANLGRFDRPDVMAAEVEAQRAQLNVTLARQSLDRTWQEIAALTQQPPLPVHPQLDGDLEALPKIDQTALENIYAQNPSLKAAQFNIAAADLAAERARVEKIPDVVARGGMRNNRELVSPGLAVGREGFFDVAVQIPLFNRNQGNLAAARAEASRARLETNRLRMGYAQRFAQVLTDYNNANTSAHRYRDEMIPKATEAYNLYINNFDQMTAAYAQVLATQRGLIQLQEEYVLALNRAWHAAVEIETLLERN